MLRYTGTYTARAQAHSKAILRHTIKRAQGSTNPDYMKMVFDFCAQLQAVDSGRASRAQQLKHDIHIWADYHDDLKELELMRGLVIEAATIKQRRAAREARRERERKEKSEFYTTRSAQ